MEASVRLQLREEIRRVGAAAASLGQALSVTDISSYSVSPSTQQRLANQEISVRALLTQHNTLDPAVAQALATLHQVSADAVVQAEQVQCHSNRLKSIVQGSASVLASQVGQIDGFLAQVTSVSATQLKLAAEQSSNATKSSCSSSSSSSTAGR
mmetsp:Transcript_31814/g.62143  ORF Transcript_31814/g.62143 Transcript_31814/m.62143 type:complete len:154 (+) Transcript_31814:427-888(+)